MQRITRIAALLLVALAVALAIVAFGLSRRALKPAATTSPATNVTTSPERATSPAGASSDTSTVVATAALPAGQPIDATLLRAIHPSKPTPGSYIHIDDVTGDVPLVDIPAGTAITTSMLAHGMAMVLKPGERALAVPTDELAGAGNRILPGDYVDVFVTLKASQAYAIGTAATPAQARLLLSHVRVLAYGSQDLPVTPATAAINGNEKSPAKSDGNAPSPRTAVLAVSVDMANRLLMGVQGGTLSLALRAPNDNSRPDDELFAQPRPVLSPLTTLTDAQRQRLASPENRAYAGIDGPGLAGRAGGGAAPAHTVRHTGATPSLEIIRGTQRGDLRSARSPSP